MYHGKDVRQYDGTVHERYAEEEKMKMMAGMMTCCEKMAAICPCMNMGSNSEKGKEGAQPANPTDKPESACPCAG